MGSPIDREDFSSERPAVRPLLRAPGIIKDESLPSLIARAAHLNVFPRPTQMIELADLRVSRLGFAPFTLPAEGARSIAALLSAPADEILVRTHPSIADAGDRVDWYGMAMPRRYLEARNRRVSPAGLAEAPFDRAAWMLRPLCYCPESLDLLIDTCASCHEKLHWRRTQGPLACGECGAQLTSQEVVAPPPHLASALRAVGELVSASIETRKARISQFPAPLNDWPAGDIFELVVELALICQAPEKVRHKRGGTPPGCYSQIRPAAIAQAYDLAAAWPSGFDNLVKRLLSHHQPKSNNQSAHVALGPMGKLVAKYCTNSRIRDLLTKELADVLWSPTIPAKHWTADTVDQIRSGELVSARDACKKTGLHFPTLRKLDPNGQCLVTNGRVRRGGKLYDLEALRRSVAVYRTAVRPSALSQKLGVPPFVLAALADSGLLRAARDSDAVILSGESVLFDRDPAQQLIDDLSALRTEDRGGGVPFEHALLGVGWNPRAWALAIQALLDGRVLPSKAMSGKGLVRGLWVPKGAFRTVHQTCGLDTPSEVTVSSATAARLLGTTHLGVGLLRKVGILEGTKAGNEFVIPLKSIASLEARYVVVLEAEVALGLHRTLLRQTLERTGVRLLDMPDNKYLIERADFERAFGLPQGGF